MKKVIITVFFVTAALFCQAQVWNLTANQFAYMSLSYGQWSDWTDWQDCEVRITVSPQAILIYSASPQAYKVNYLISSNRTTWKWQCTDWQGIACQIRFVNKNGGSQIYVDYSNIKWVYMVTLDN